jgi:hypothetical protein
MNVAPAVLYTERQPELQLSGVFMVDEFETKTEDTDSFDSDEERGEKRARIGEVFRNLLKRVVMLVSFGPGVLGVLWLIGRILRR